jgi:hypothetical protein
VKRFRDRQTALYVDLKRAIGLRLADMLKLHRSMIQPDGLRVDSGKRGKKREHHPNLYRAVQSDHGDANAEIFRKRLGKKRRK